MADGFDTDHSTPMARTVNVALVRVKFAMSPTADASRKGRGGFQTPPPEVVAPQFTGVMPPAPLAVEAPAWVDAPGPGAGHRRAEAPDRVTQSRTSRSTTRPMSSSAPSLAGAAPTAGPDWLTTHAQGGDVAG